MNIGATAQDWIGERVLQVPDRDGCWVPHFQVKGIWTKTGFGAFTPEFPRRVLQHLGVS